MKIGAPEIAPPTESSKTKLTYTVFLTEIAMCAILCQFFKLLSLFSEPHGQVNAA